MPLVRTKLHIPKPNPKTVIRQHLLDHLNTDLRSGPDFLRKLTLISAPAGFGKTTLVSQWLQQNNFAATWLSLDEPDNDPVRFWRYSIAALQTIHATLGEAALSAWQAPQPAAIEAVLNGLINDLADIPTPLLFVLDDYHLINTSAIHQALTFLLDHGPATLHLVIITRADPPLPLAQLRVRGHLTEIRQTDLRFNIPETEALLNQSLGLNLDNAQIAILEDRTEGWVASLQLAALSLRGETDVPGFIERFGGSHRYVLDYLSDEIFERQPDYIQSFLLQTAILKRLSGPLCAALINQTLSHRAASILDQLEQANLFLIPLDHERQWYRYHALFQDFLRMKLHQQDAALVVELHQRAATWLTEEGYLTDAIEHLLAIDDSDTVATLIIKAAPQHLKRGEAMTILDWLKNFSPADLAQRPALVINYGWALLTTGQIKAAEEKVALIDRAANQVLPDTPLGQWAALRATIAAMQRQVNETITYSQQAFAHLPPDDSVLRPVITWNLAFAYRLKGEFQTAADYYQAAIIAAQETDHQVIAILATIGLGNLQAGQCQYTQALTTYQQAIKLGQTKRGHSLPTTLEAYLGLAEIAYEQNNLSSLKINLKQGQDLLARLPNPDHAVPLMRVEVKQWQAQGAFNDAARILQQAKQLVQKHNLTRRVQTVANMEISLLIKQGNLDTALELAQTHQLSLSQARVYLAQNKPETALTILTPLLLQSPQMITRMDRLKILICQALALHLTLQPEPALLALEQALALAAPNGIKRSFVDAGPAMRDLLLQAHAQGLFLDYVITLLPLFDADSEQSTIVKPSPAPSALLIEPLSGRELEVLALIVAGLTNQEIADEQVVALSTVKWHIRNIYGKLQVRNRAQAIAAAQKLGLLT